MASDHLDVIVIGGGPAGSTLATLLARRGKRVLLFERERFPRFHIGESLLPCSMPLFRELGVLEELERRFLPKFGAEFVTNDGSLARRYCFGHGMVPGPDSAFEVDRAEFDRVLLDNAVLAGASVREGFQVTAVELEQDHVTVTARDEHGVPSEHRAALVVDAGGQQSLLASRLGLRRMDPELRNYALFSHFSGATRHTGLEEGDISVVLAPEGWWWVIPLRNDRTSVGLVAPARSLHGRKPDEAYLNEQIASSPYLAERLAPSRRVAPVRTISDWSYSTERLAGDRWLLVGDAGAFIDPVFSTGVYLGMVGAFKAAEAVDRALDRKSFRRAEFVEYERWVQRAVGRYREFVRGFYHPAFVDLLLHPSDWMGIRAAVTSLLAGHGVDRFDVGWRVLLFRMLAQANRRVKLTPRLPGRREAYAS